MTININTYVKKIILDQLTPVSIYLKIRERFSESILLESADYQEEGINSFTFISFDPIAEFRVNNKKISKIIPNKNTEDLEFKDRKEVVKEFNKFIDSFNHSIDPEFKFLNIGVYGYTAYDAISHFEDIELKSEKDIEIDFPELLYRFYKYTIAINHHTKEFYLIYNQEESSQANPEKELDEIIILIKKASEKEGRFTLKGEESSNFTDEEYLKVVDQCKQHVFRGDVFQIVPSRRFYQSFDGDDFNVYRALRSVNPSPYLFYFDCGDFRIFGSSPEAELIVQNNKATIHPIAGTCPRTGDEEKDQDLINKLKADPKENSEHVMLVDLARNDLSKHCTDVHLESYKEIHKYSHVMHLVSKVTGSINAGKNIVELLADTFPAGTLTGAPKYRAMELIDTYETCKRLFYGGAIGHLGFNGSCNHAIIIRSFLSYKDKLIRQAGGGVVADSVPESEVLEVKNKLGALKKALSIAESL
ncbi:UNVERIFIED_CONTAM: hypothetical protein GTU68_066428 [Idotea baltica]|nr:hypothetical protein [Idotea baltica]